MKFSYNGVLTHIKECDMYKKMTITLDEAIYDGLKKTIGKRKMSQFIGELLRPYVLNQPLDEGYKAMAQDTAREAEALEWSQALMQDSQYEAR